MCPVAVGIMSDGPQRIIPREEWEQAFKEMKAQEFDWDGERIKAKLFVELPFWLMMQDASFAITFKESTIQAAIHSDFIELSSDACFLDSRINLRYLGSGEAANTDPIVEKIERRVVRPLKTVVEFEVCLLKEVFSAIEDTRSRRVNRANHYFRSLAIAHIPFLNRLLVAYRATSRDPFAFEISEWDVPLWWTKYDGKLIRTCLMPYKESDEFPVLRSFETGEKSKFLAIDAHQVQEQLRGSISPGELELLDARNLMRRGRYSDAVRAVVTAIEVALEHQLRILYRKNGCTEEQCDLRLSDNKSSFYFRLSEFETLSQRRLPGPTVDRYPHLNGLRLRNELDRARELRHRIVHEGFRIDYFSKGLAHRAVDTMTWLFHWMSKTDPYSERQTRNDELFGAVFGIQVFPFRYTADGIEVCSDRHEIGATTATADELILEQYAGTLEPKTSDLELFVAMTFEYLGIGSEDAPPENPNDPLPRERYRVQIDDRYLLVFCLEFDGLPDTAAVEAVNCRLKSHIAELGSPWQALCLIHHQRHQPLKSRKVEDAIPEELCQLAVSSGITLITAVDLRFLVQGAGEYGWDIKQLRQLLYALGRQGNIPPGYQDVGSVFHFYGRRQVVSIELNQGATIELDDTICIRLATRYDEQRITSLQVHGNAVDQITGPGRVGVVTALTRKVLAEGQSVFIRRPSY